MTHPIEPDAVDFVRRAAGSERYAGYLAELLMEFVALNTAGEGPIPGIAAREATFFDALERRVAGADPGATVQRVPIGPDIADDPDYTFPAYAARSDDRPLSAERIYADRCNLLVSRSGRAGKAPHDRPLVLHAHVDVVPPWFPPRREGSRIYGRGACDNKSQVSILLAQMRLLRELENHLGRPAARERAYHFVVDEEIGGNGSLALALDPRWAGATVLVHETTGLTPYCAHRGCVDYRCRLSTGGVPEISALEMFPLVVIALENEGRRIGDESNAPMFGPSHVQTNHGMLGGFGHSCGAVCDHVAFEISARARANAHRIAMKLVEFLDEAVVEYVKLYGDKTRERDSATGEPKIARHFDVKAVPGPEFHRIRLDVYGKGGHMGSLGECDNAITKAAYLLAALMHVGRQFPQVRAFARLLDDPDAPPPPDPRAAVPAELMLQGGQGFTPSHRMEDVKMRLAAAARRGAEEYCRLRRVPFHESMVRMTFDSLHNDACADSPDNEPMQALRAAFAVVGEPWPEPVAWQTSCDAGIYRRRGCPVAIFGAGRLDVAHGPDEYVELSEMQKALAISTLATWAMTR